MGYVGNQQTEGFSSIPAKQDLTGASGTSLTLSHAVASAEGIDLFINNVRQEPTTAYSVVGTAVTLTGSVAASDDIYVVYNSLALQTTVPPDASVSDAKIVSMSASKLTGALPAIDGSNLTGLSNIKEQLAMLCDGNNYTVPSGTYTAANVTAQQVMTNTSTDIIGSSISYTPPSGTTMVMYEFRFSHDFTDTDTITHIKSFIDGVEVTSQRQSIQSYSAFNLEYHHTFLIPIGGSADTATGRQSSWTSAKTLKIQARSFSTVYEAEFHTFRNWDGATDTSGQIRKPQLIITALG